MNLHPTTADADTLYRWQIKQLATPVDERFVQSERGVQGKYTGHTFVGFKLNEIFGPGKWRMTIQESPTFMRISDKYGYMRCVVKLEVIFANGRVSQMDAAGMRPLLADDHKEGGTLETTKPARYTSAEKAAVSDGLKVTAQRLGQCFKPLNPKDPLKGYISGAGHQAQLANWIAEPWEGKQEPAPVKATPSTPANSTIAKRPMQREVIPAKEQAPTPKAATEKTPEPEPVTHGTNDDGDAYKKFQMLVRNNPDLLHSEFQSKVVSSNGLVGGGVDWAGVVQDCEKEIDF